MTTLADILVYVEALQDAGRYSCLTSPCTLLVHAADGECYVGKGKRGWYSTADPATMSVWDAGRLCRSLRDTAPARFLCNAATLSVAGRVLVREGRVFEMKPEE